MFQSSVDSTQGFSILGGGDSSSVYYCKGPVKHVGYSHFFVVNQTDIVGQVGYFGLRRGPEEGGHNFANAVNQSTFPAIVPGTRCVGWASKVGGTGG